MSRAVPSHLAPLEDARLEQAASAARTARRNQPKGLFVIAGVLLLLSMIYALTAWMSYREAGEDLADAHTQADTAVKMAGKLQALRAAASSNPTQGGSASLLRTRIEQAGLDAGLSRAVTVPTSRSQPFPSLGSVQWKYSYENITDPSLSALLAWVEKSVASVPGLEVYSISIKPQPNQWQLRVTFSRWEKAEGSP